MRQKSRSAFALLLLTNGLLCVPFFAKPSAGADAPPDLAACRAAVQRAPESAEAHKNLGNALCDLGKYDEAIREYRAALRLDPRYAKGYHNLGRALYYKNDFAASAAAYHKAIALQPDYPAAYFDLGVTLDDSGHPAEAVVAYRQAARQQPSDIAAHGHLGIALSRQGKHVEALAEFEKVAALDPDDMAHISPVARELDALGRRADAWHLLRQAEALAPKCPVTHYTEGRFCAQEGRWQEAADHFRVTLESTPDFAPAHLALGTALEHLGQRADARVEWQHAVEVGDAEDAQAAQENLARYR